jgi:hypothetical protein
VFARFVLLDFFLSVLGSSLVFIAVGVGAVAGVG